MKKKYLFLTMMTALLAGCSATPGETDDSSRFNHSKGSESTEFSESMDSSSFESERSL